jgi:cyclopropane fatty-acyl-phospholipid synthase-like methyltransferase
MSERRGLWSPLANAIVYEAVHHVTGARRWMKRFARETIRARDGERVLDIGCGPGALLRYLPGVTYVGLDRNQANIERAKRTYGARGTFICDDVGNFARHALAPVDVAVAIGILHHLGDDLALNLLRATARALKPGGRLITVDPCYHREQSPVQRLVVSCDRGLHVRPFERYVNLCGSVFPEPKATFRRGHFPFPYSTCTVETVAPANFG